MIETVENIFKIDFVVLGLIAIIIILLIMLRKSKKGGGDQWR